LPIRQVWGFLLLPSHQLSAISCQSSELIADDSYESQL
jgi:hypothetical protein